MPGDLYPYYGQFDYSSGLAGSDVSLSLLILLGLLVLGMAYAFGAVALYAVAKRRDLEEAYFAFVPFLNVYLIGELADNIGLSMNRRTKYSLRNTVFFSVWLALWFCSQLVSVGPELFVGFTGPAIFLVVLECLFSAAAVVVFAVFAITFFASLMIIYKEYAYKHAVLYFVISIIVPLSCFFFLFAVRKNKSGYELWCEARESEHRTVRFEEEETEAAVEEVFSSVPDNDIDSDQTTIE